MSLNPGTRLGPFEILSPIGRGGMGEVYKAKDTRLDRTVAVKVLTDDLADRPESRARFEREAKAISQLNHPHICTLYDVGEQDGVMYLVMEYIDGQTLAERLKKGALPLDQALEYGIQIADGLDTAHRAGIVHRDLKPGNAMLTKLGVKLLDFGLAKLVEDQSISEDSDAPTRQKDLTKQHAILGTLQYMAPEQLEGKRADHRTDLWAFGAVLYEMLTGNKAFHGASQASLIAAILEHEPARLSKTTSIRSRSLDRVLQRCLAKDPDGRWQSASDLNWELQCIQKDGALDRTRPSVRRGRWHAVVPVLAAAVTTVVIAALVGLRFDQPPSERVTRFAIDPVPADEFHIAGDTQIAVSPDGRLLAFSAGHVGTEQIYIRRLDALEATPLVPATERAHTPFFSPDSQWLGFFSDHDRTLKKVPVAGGPPVTICPVPESHMGATWSEDDTIVFASFQFGLARVPASGGLPEPLHTPETEGVTYGYPARLPDQSGILFTILSRDGTAIAVLPADGGSAKILAEGGTDPRYSPTGHLLYGQLGNLMAMPFDLSRLEARERPVPVVEKIIMSSAGVYYSLADNGTLLYASDTTARRQRNLVWVDRTGATREITSEQLPYRDPRLSPDGTRVVVGIEGDLAVLDIERGTRRRLTFDGALEAAWTPDGRRVAFTKDRTKMEWVQADGSAEPALLFARQYNVSPHSWSPDGKVLAFYENGEETLRDIWTFAVDSGEKPEPFLVTDFNERSPSFSPDGRFLAYVSDESGRDEIYLQPYPGPGAKVTISMDGGTDPTWCSAKGELYYRHIDRMMVVPITTTPSLQVGAPRVLFEGEFRNVELGSGSRTYDVSPNCEQFLMITENTEQQTKLNVVLNWFDELERLVPTDN